MQYVLLIVADETDITGYNNNTNTCEELTSTYIAIYILIIIS